MKTLLAMTATFFVLTSARAQTEPPAPPPPPPGDSNHAALPTQAFENACQADAATAGCSGEHMMQCLHVYKRKHKEFKLSDSCKSAMMQMHEHRMERMQH